MSDTALVDHCLELLAPLGRTRARRMFSGHGLYIDDLCVAIIIRDTLFLKTAEADRGAFQAAGCTPFTYETRNGERVAMGYWSAPDAAMESPAEMVPWARRALAAAVAARAKAPRKKPKASAGAANEVVAKKVVAKKVVGKKVAAKRALAKKAVAGKSKPAARKAAA
jgi:DNA transformation protein